MTTLSTACRSLSLALLVACGGGPSVSTEPGASITDARCNMFGSTSIMFDGDYQVTLLVGQVFAADLQLSGVPPPQTVNEFYSCVFWDDLPGDQGCVRNSLDDEASEMITHTVSFSFDAPLPPPVSISVFAGVRSSPGSTDTIGSSDFEDVPCI